MDLIRQERTFVEIQVSIKPRVVFLTGLTAGTLDGLAAAISYYISTHKDPLNVYRYVASAIFGMDAFSGGVPMAICGVFFHYIVAFGWTILFFSLAVRLSFFLKNWIVSGILYGIFVWIIMNLAIVPLSNVPANTGPKEWSAIIKGAVILIFCIGLPIAYSASHYLKRPN